MVIQRFWYAPHVGLNVRYFGNIRYNKLEIRNGNFFLVEGLAEQKSVSTILLILR